jgi:lactoylglutathione lyase
MKFLWTTLSVADFDRSLKFYQEVVGLPLKRRMDPPGMNIAFLGEGETAIELIYDSKRPQVDLKSPVAIGFKVENLAAALADFQAKGVKIDAGPFKPNPQVQFFYVRDPDGMNVQFVEESFAAKGN